MENVPSALFAFLFLFHLHLIDKLPVSCSMMSSESRILIICTAKPVPSCHDPWVQGLVINAISEISQIIRIVLLYPLEASVNLRYDLVPSTSPWPSSSGGEISEPSFLFLRCPEGLAFMLYGEKVSIKWWQFIMNWRGLFFWSPIDLEIAEHGINKVNTGSALIFCDHCWSFYICFCFLSVRITTVS